MRNLRRSLTLFMVVAAITAPAFAQATSRTYTTNADFDLGVLFNVNHTTPNDNQLQLNTTLTTYPVMWIANAGEDSVSKIDTTTGRELARYRTWFGPSGQPGYYGHLGMPWSGAAPSRTAVDSDGNVYVANRHFDGRPPDVVKILVEGGIDRNGNGVIDTSIDANNDGVISPAEMLPMADSNYNGRIDPGEIQDEKIAWVATLPPETAGRLGRSLAIGLHGDIWVSASGSYAYYKLSAADGSLLGGPYPVAPNYPYGAMVDKNGILWGASLGVQLLRLDTATGAATTFNHSAYGGDYGIALGNNKVYLGGGGGFLEFDPATNLFRRVSGVYTLGVATDSAGNIYTGSNALQKFAPDGTQLWYSAAFPWAGECRGIQVDSDGNVWQVDLSRSVVYKRDGATGAHIGAYPVGNSPYTYTDATGLSRFTSTIPTGRWSIIQDGGAAATHWGKVSWSGTMLGNILVEARAADTQAGLGAMTFVPMPNGIFLPTANELVGRFIEVRSILSADVDGNSPVLTDLTIEASTDLVPPVFTFHPGDVSVQCPGDIPPEDPNAATATDDRGSVTMTVATTSNGGAGSAASPLILTRTWTATDAAGNTATATQIITIIDSIAPTVDPITAQTVLTTECSLPVPAFVVSAHDNCSGALAVAQVPAAGTMVGLGTHNVTITVTDAVGNATSVPTTFTVTNAPPTVSGGGPYTVDEGSSVALAATGSDAGGPVTFDWDLDNNGSFETPGATPAFLGVDGPNTVTVKVRATDSCGQTAVAPATIVINNVPPTATISAPAMGALYAVNSPVTVTTSFTDPGTLDTHTCSVNWDNAVADPTGNVAAGVVSETGGSGNCTATYTFINAGVYSVNVTITDKDGGTGSAGVMVVVYDPSAGFVTGGGWIMSPAGALVAKPDATGKANFGFVSKYQKGATTPTGNTEFNFNTGDFRFHSASYEWLVISGRKAQYRGTGQVNGSGDYGFLLVAYDEDMAGGDGIDKFRIKIWDRSQGNTLVYDNRLGSPDDVDTANPQNISGGSIVIHSK